MERYNGIVWKSISLALKSRKLPLSAWENVLPDALHSIRSLLCTATNCTPHERTFNFQRKSTAGKSVLSWLLTKGTVYVRKHVKTSKYESPVEKAELISANPEYAFVRLKNGFETTVSIRDLAPCTRDTRDNDKGMEEEDDEYDENVCVPDHPILNKDAMSPTASPPSSPPMTPTRVDETSTQDYVTPTPILETTTTTTTRDNEVATKDNVGDVRRSSRKRNAPEKFCDSKYLYVGILGFSCQ